MSDSMSQTKRSFIIGTSFLLTFFLFLYSSFPYSVLKEYVAAEVNQATDLGLHIGELSPSFPIGIELSDVKFGGRMGEPVELSSVQVNVGILSLFTGHLSLDASVMGRNAKGELSVYGSVPISGLISGQPIPDSVEITSKLFPVGPIVNYALKAQSVAPGVNPMLKDLLGKISFTGNLDAQVNVDVNINNPKESAGILDVKLTGSKLFFDEGLSIGTQQFSKARVKVDIQEGKVNVDKNSGLKSKELQLDLSGRVDLRETFAKSLLNMSLKVKLLDQLKENFGLILTAVSQGRALDGSMALQISGPMAAPNVVSL